MDIIFIVEKGEEYRNKGNHCYKWKYRDNINTMENKDVNTINIRCKVFRNL